MVESSPGIQGTTAGQDDGHPQPSGESKDVIIFYRIEKLLEGAPDPTEFLQKQKQRWEREMKQKLAKVEQRRLEDKLRYEEAWLTRKKIIEENKMKATLQKEQTAELLQQCAEKCKDEEKEKKAFVKEVAEGEKNVQKSKEAVQKHKQRTVQEMTEEKQKMLSQALEKVEADLCRKFEVMRQIRAVEPIPATRQKFVDHTQILGPAFLNEMSLVELHERLAMLKEAQKKEEEEKREMILDRKESKKRMLMDQLEQISQHRTAMKEFASFRKENETKRELETSPAINERILELQRKLEDKRQERERMSEELKIKEKRDLETMGGQNSKSPEDQRLYDLHKKLEEKVHLMKDGNITNQVFKKLFI
ncbi:cilia- and flagella-associated protein 99-like [Erpetoichthys calabaricus]|uniref:cilia- and flagella-associated protein 99-like n=1 Tax=Erpetoichthys calabaricus TaxID=27687 RepID=UPI0022341687|nr:cilia- and flagella-associated protein 99-like [Erpetoichthys calabaricus]